MRHRVSFYYDDEYDFEIVKILESVPERRRSEQIRKLLSQALTGGKSSVSPQQPVPYEQSSAALKRVEDNSPSQAQRVRKHIRILPPDLT